MSLGTSHPNLYKTNREEIKSPARLGKNLNASNAKVLIFIGSFLLVTSFSIATALANHAFVVNISDNTSTPDRIVGTGNADTILIFNITNQPNSGGAITGINITNATTGSSGYNLTNTSGGTGATCTILNTLTNCTGFSIAAGTSYLFNITVRTPTDGNSGRGNWTVNTSTASDTATQFVYTLAVDEGVDIGIDLRDEFNNASAFAADNDITVSVRNTTTDGLRLLAGGAAVLVVEKTDDDNDGLILLEEGSDINVTSGSSADGNFAFNVTRPGFVNVSDVTNSYSRTNINSFAAAPLNFSIRVNVTDEFGSAQSGATVNVTDLPITPLSLITNSSFLPNLTLNNFHYFGLPDRYDNITVIVNRSGFIDNATFVNITVATPANRTVRASINSTYNLFFVLRVNVTDERGIGSSMMEDVSFLINNTVSTANRTHPTDLNAYYFSIGQVTWGAANVTARKAGYVNASVNENPLNRTTRADVNPRVQFRLRVNVRSELGGAVPFNSDVIIALNNTTSAANVTSVNSYYFNISTSGINVTAARQGYINSTNNTIIPLNETTQANLSASMNFSIRVTDICNEFGGPGSCYAIDGSDAIAEISGNGSTNTTYSGGDGFINATNNATNPYNVILINASKNGYVNRTMTIRVNQSTQARLVFNGSDQTGVASDRADGLLFTIRVLSLYDEIYVRNFTLNTSTLGSSQIGAGVDLSGQNNNVFFNTTRGEAYVNATGTSAVDLVAFTANYSWINRTVSVTPNPAAQQTVLFNATGNSLSNGLSANVIAGGLIYPIAITVQDELGAGNSSYMTSGVVFGFNTSGSGVGYTVFTTLTQDARNNSVYYFTNQSWPLPNGTNVTIARIGYINTSSTQNLLINLTTQANLTLQMPFNLRVGVLDELSQALGPSPVNYSANNTNQARGSSNATNVTFAYFALPIATVASNGTAFVNVSRIGYVDNATVVDPINTTNQSRANVSLLYNIRVFLVCNELNSTCFTINGNIATDGTAAVEVSGVATNYSAGTAYIPATNYSQSIVNASARGYVNTTVAVWPNSTTRNSSVMFNATAGVAQSQVNGSGLNFTVRIQSICDQWNYTCFILNSSGNAVGAAGANVSTENLATASVNSTRYNTTANFAYIPVPGTSSVNVVAFALGYINSTQSVTPVPDGNQVTINWNNSKTQAMNYSTAITVRDQGTGSLNMNTGVIIYRNLSINGGFGETLSENRSVFRSGPGSNVYYINISNGTVVTPGGANLTVKRDGYINTSTPDFSVNTSTQGNLTVDMQFSVRIRTRDQSGTSYTNATIQFIDDGANTFTINDGNLTLDTLYNNSVLVANSTAGQGDNSTTADGDIYWALNQSNVTSSIDVTVFPNRNGYEDWRIFSRSVNYASQLSLVSANVRDTTAPTAATGVTATITGKQVSATWTASTSNDVSYYRVFRNTTLLGTSAITSFTDYPTRGDSSAPGAPSGLSAVKLNTSGNQIQVSWSAPTNAIYNYSVLTVDTAGNAATSNATSSNIAINPAAYYLVYRNDTLLGTTSTTAYTDTPLGGLYTYSVTTVSDGNVSSSSNGTVTIDIKDTSGPSAVTSLTATTSGKSVSVTWVASASNDTSSYRVIRNITLVGSPGNTTTYTDNPTLYDTTAPGAASSVTATQVNGTISLSWTAPANFIYNYTITPIDTSGNVGTNATSSTVSLSPVGSYRVYRNGTLLGGSPGNTTGFTDTPVGSNYQYAVETVSDAGTLASTNGTVSIDTRDTTAPSAATSVTATASGKAVSVTWTASASNDTSYYRVIRNITLIGSSANTTAFVDNPTLYDTTAPGAASGVTAVRSGNEVQVSWTAPANFIYNYTITAVDTSGNLAANATSSTVSLSPVAHYRVYRNDTLLGTSSTTSFTDTPGTLSVYTYSITTVSDANTLAGSNGTSSAIDLRDTTAPSAATSVTATASGKQVSVSWTASSSNDTSYYRVYRNNTLVGSSGNVTSFTDSPTFGDTTAPGAPSGVTATIAVNNATYREVQLTWTAPANSIFNYSINTVDTSGNAAATNGTLLSGAASVSPVAYYRIYRNNTLLDTSSATSFTDTPNAGIYVYSIETVSDAVVRSSSNGTSSGVSLGELVGPTITITVPGAANVTSTTPTISFTVIDNDGGVGVDINTIAVNISGFNATRDCLRNNDLNYTCTYTANTLTDSVNHTITVAAKDKFSNPATNATRNFGVNSAAGVTASLNSSDTSAIADNTFANGWSFTFNITLGGTTSNVTTVNATAVKIANWTRVGGSDTIVTAGNTIMNYTISNGTAATYYVSHNYNATDTIYPLQDLHTSSVPINGTVTIYMKIPAATVPGTYSTTFTFGSWSVALTGGNPT